MSEPDRPSRSQTGIQPRTAAVVLGALMVVGLGLRLVHISDPPLTYQPSRQYHSLLIVRNWYLGNGGSAPSQAQRVASAARAPLIEPPIMEALTWMGWELAGRQIIWLGGLLSSLIWVGGSAFVYALGRRLQGRLAGLVGAAVFLFTPQALVASRAFQPDPLMVVALAGAMLALVIDDQRRTRRSLAIAGVACGFAVLVKLVGAFYVLPVVALLALGHGGVRGLVRRRTFVLAAMSLFPAMLYVVYGALVNHYLTQQSGQRFELWLLGTSYFWHQWSGLATVMVGIGPIVVALVGLVLSRGPGRAVLAGLTVGYLAFGVFFDFALSTSIYYHLPLVLPVCLGVATTTGAIERWMRTSREPSLTQVGAATACAIAVASPLFSGGWTAPAVTADARARVVADAAPIGSAIGHDTKVIVVSPADGDPLRFYGPLAGATWPVAGNQYVRRVEGSAGLSDAQQLAELNRTLNGAHYLVGDVDELATHPGLETYLDQHYRLVTTNRHYRVYDLRHPPAG